MDAIRDWWERRDRREQRWLAALAILAALALLHQWVAVPLQAASDRNRTRIASERQRLSTMHARADEIAALARKPTKAEFRDLAETVRRLVAELPVSGSDPATVEAADRSVRVHIPATTFDALVGALEPALSNSGARIGALAVVALTTPGLVRVELEIVR